MKLITLNTWAGRLDEAQIEFLKKHAKDTDVFCFQEVYMGTKRLEMTDGAKTDMFSVYSELLSEFRGEPAQANYHDIDGTKMPYGLALFVRKDISVLERGVYEIFSLTEPVELAPGLALWNRLLQYVTLPYKDSQLTIYNLHGLYTGGGKGDNVSRLEQSRRIKKFMESRPGERILCGDFNLNPDTESLKILEESMRNLVKEAHVTSTRNSYYKKEGRFADYILVSRGVEVKAFEVLQDEISDHLPLKLEFL